MVSHFMESLTDSQQLDDGNAKSDTESDIDSDTELIHIHIDDISDAEDSENPSKLGDEARPRFKNCRYQIFFCGNLELLFLPQWD